MSEIKCYETFEFNKVIDIIESTKTKVYKKINEEIITMYFNIGKFLTSKIKNEEYGNSYLCNLACYIKERYPRLKGFIRVSLYRMMQFYETYKDYEIVSPLVRQISLTDKLLISSYKLSAEEKRI